MAASIKDIKKAIAEDIKSRRKTYEDVAKDLGSTRHTIGNLLSNDKRISQNFAKKFADAYGYDPNFLLYGEGQLYAPGQGAVIKDPDFGNGVPYVLGGKYEKTIQSRKLRSAAYLLQILNNKLAIEAFDAMVQDNEDKYKECVNLLVADYGYDFPFDKRDPKAVDRYLKVRETLTMLEVDAAKELVVLEEEIHAGKVTEMEVVTERFRKKAERTLKANSIKENAATQAKDELESEMEHLQEKQNEIKKFFETEFQKIEEKKQKLIKKIKEEKAS
jgi:transcriptional regulator with XRE-family HTH domain